MKKEKSIKDCCVNSDKFMLYQNKTLKCILAREHIVNPSIDVHNKMLEIISEYAEPIRQNYCVSKCDIANICVIGQEYKKRVD